MIKVPITNILTCLRLQAAQQGHSQIVNLLLDANASPNTMSNVSVKYQQWRLSPVWRWFLVPSLQISNIVTNKLSSTPQWPHLKFIHLRPGLAATAQPSTATLGRPVS